MEKKFHGQISILALLVTIVLTILFIGATYFILTGIIPVEGSKVIGLFLLSVLSLIGISFILITLYYFFRYPYVLDTQGIIIRNPAKKLIQFSDIENLEKIDNLEAKRIIKLNEGKKYSWPNDGVFIPKELKNLIKYLTYSPHLGFSVSNFHSEETGLWSYKVVLDPKIYKCNFILVTLKTGQKHLLSPNQAELFLEYFEKMH